MSWNEEKVTKLKELWGKGSTASQIAEIIGGISRNAVIGKAHRLNLSSKIKIRNKSSSHNFQSSNEENKLKQKRARKVKQNTQKIVIAHNDLLFIHHNEFTIFYKHLILNEAKIRN